ncbi:MAG: tRNA (adenosine(37)-N6)-threonylcarbamoyltransferase complex dimerization subunit type 1 TsaB [Salaquimonas sp.]
MICLALDTAGTACAACLYDSKSKTVLAQLTEDIGKGHAERLMGIITDVMQMAEITYQDLDKIITTIGPGSFTGIRVGVATARGFGVGLNIPVVGVTNLEAIAAQYRQENRLDDTQQICAAIDAGRGQVYCLMNFDNNFAVRDEAFAGDLSDVQTFLANLKDVHICGNAAPLLSDQNGSNKICVSNRHQAWVHVIAAIGASRDEGDKMPEPLYLRKPDAVPQKGFAVERVS